MKRLLNITLCVLLASGAFLSGCKQAAIDEAYLNPNKTTSADVQRLWAAMLFNEAVIPRYWNLYTFQVPALGNYSQTSGTITSNGIYEQPTAYASTRWDIYFTQTMARYREMEKVYKGLATAEDKAGLLLFMETGRIFLYDQTAQMIDMWGDIPFTAAGSLNADGTITLPAYDDAETTYKFLLTDLKRISDYLTTVTPSSFYATQFSSYDYVNKGDLAKWRKYCNALMLRLAMRISYKDEATAKALVTTILSNPANYPLPATAKESITIQAGDVNSNLVAKTAMREGLAVNPYPAAAMVNDVMNTSQDPRLAVLFTKTSKGTYQGVSKTWTATQYTDAVTANGISRWDSTTFYLNDLFPGILMTSGETWFNVAEANERWGLGNAKTAYESGIRQSIAFWTAINNASSWTGAKEAVPTEAAITAFLANANVAYGTDNLKKIATQKWIDFTIMQANQAWSDYRRTRLLNLPFPTDNGSASAPNPPTRLLYPTSEASLNTVNYNAVKGKDNIKTKIFWDVK
ncbi:SusD/RagB family nutrient-binding outer membrane lipoprotein [Siphonobacter aquaeclarae]|uniref:Starch-binding associating with outer membrane n=1 Tax=Siphonobacter aquaeclarae TaxID=563176 RepID=A0A1G9VBN3_9BACT|nr:SusD/RagB family nutrient-binding outer membrane lipoprotein [Siphonobacter aquaeclarae]SDM69496.1 Starch-binding associating with outer membrane [Siphonobacter aquaeclarae]